jgi:ferrochelatase
VSSRFRGVSGFQHGRAPKLGIVLVNLGTPEAPTAPALRKYLAEFLSDPRVVEIPRVIWMLILHGIILRVRPKKSAHGYATVWSDEGSPLMAISNRLTQKVSAALRARIPGPVEVRLAMRYGQPAVDRVLTELQDAGCERLLVVPLYPQYSGATTGSVADAVFASLQRWRWVPELRLLGAYHDDRRYIRALADSVRAHWQQSGEQGHLLMSFHGMPRATLDAGDPYHCHCHKTARLLAEELGLQAGQWEIAFQSRFGPAEWLQPYAAERFEVLPKEGKDALTVVCPGFSADCLETLEEIAIQGRDSFIEAGGRHFSYVPALNESEAHVALMVERILEQAAGWPELDAAQQAGQVVALQTSAEQARAAGAAF